MYRWDGMGKETLELSWEGHAVKGVTCSVNNQFPKKAPGDRDMQF